MKKYIFNKRYFFKLLGIGMLFFLVKKIKSNGNPYRDRFQSYRQTFRIEPDAEETQKIIKNIIKGRKLAKNLIDLKVPDIAEDGNVVPITFKINCSMSKNDYPEKVHILALENPFPEVAVYQFQPDMGIAEVSFRCRMRDSAFLMIIAEMSDGRVAVKKKYVDVMLGACS
tara:strand:+ start:1400 stop:1909 length:510 start_codon:yes stop_codon:yes gene_type:complete